MHLKELERKYIVLNYSFGSYWGDPEGGEDLLTIWKVKMGKLDSMFHPGEPDTIESEIESTREAIRLLNEHKITEVYTPYVNTFWRKSHFLGLKREYKGRGQGEWLRYEPICIGEENWVTLKQNRVDIKLFNLDK
ncbi:hypothetical protein KW787_03330 [Candidatus Pacearchaeota archaeon]|nr:hypothetical protein [Candidatus Pacearchaeota archaeon]